jgi:2-succinyl-6-hydroxy-2,4-cyclohexadiene-1-carboxylate synthase
VVLLHGFTGCGGNWTPLVQALQSNHEVITIDLPGHGQTTASDNPADYTIERTAEALVQIFAVLNLAPVHLLGYSMGGRLALYFALTYPHLLRALILESASPGLDSAIARANRRTQDNALADRIEQFGVEAFVNHWEAIPLFATQAQLPPEARHTLRQQRLKNTPTGLANSLRGMGTGVQPSLWDRLPELTLPTLILTGALDHKFTEIAQRMVAYIPNAQHHIIPNAGHTLHLEQPQAYFKQIQGFLQTLSQHP